MSLIQLTPKDLKTLKQELYDNENQKCPILDAHVPFNDMVIDHQHKLKSEMPDVSGKGLVRGTLSRVANSWEGKVSNSFKRYGLDKHIDLPTALRNLADYLDNNLIHEGRYLIHPTEKPPVAKLMKTSYNELLRQQPTEKVPEYTGRCTKPLMALFEKYNIVPKFYGEGL